MGLLGSYIRYLGKMAEKEIEEGVREVLPKARNLVYLDCGCYDGEKTWHRANIIGTEKVFGIEVEEAGIKKAKKKGIRVYRADLNGRWPFKKESVDIITATEVIEHLVDIDNFFSEARRVLKTRGRMIISTENLAAYPNIFALLLGNQPYTGPYLSRIYPIGHKPHAKYYKKGRGKNMNPHLNVMTTKALLQLLRIYGFKVEQARGLSFYPFPPLISNLLAKADTYHASYCLVMAKKDEKSQ